MNLLLALLLATGIGKSAINQSFSEGIGSRYYNVSAVDREVLAGFTYYLQAGDPDSYSGSGRTMTSVLPSPPSPYPTYSATSLWYRYNSRLDPAQEVAPTFSNGWFLLPTTGGVNPSFWLQFSDDPPPAGIGPVNTKFNANGEMTIFWRGNISSVIAGNQPIVAITAGGFGGGQFNWSVNGTTVSVGRAYIETLGSVACIVPRNQDVVLALRRTAGATWSVFLDGVLQGSFVSATVINNSDVTGTLRMGIGLLRPPSDSYPAVEFFDGKWQSFLSYDTALSDEDIAFNSEKLALWGASP